MAQDPPRRSPLVPRGVMSSQFGSQPGLDRRRRRTIVQVQSHAQAQSHPNRRLRRRGGIRIWASPVRPLFQLGRSDQSACNGPMTASPCSIRVRRPRFLAGRPRTTTLPQWQRDAGPLRRPGVRASQGFRRSWKTLDTSARRSRSLCGYPFRRPIRCRRWMPAPKTWPTRCWPSGDDRGGLIELLPGPNPLKNNLSCRASACGSSLPEGPSNRSTWIWDAAPHENYERPVHLGFCRPLRRRTVRRPVYFRLSRSPRRMAPALRRPVDCAGGQLPKVVGLLVVRRAAALGFSAAALHGNEDLYCQDYRGPDPSAQ